VTAIGAEQPLDAEQLFEHACHIDELRSRLDQTRIAFQRHGSDESAFGPVCGWILSDLSKRYTGNDQLIAYVAESLHLAVEGLLRVVDGRQSFTTWIGEPADQHTDDTTPMTDLSETINDREWVEPQLAGAAPIAEFAAPADDMHTALRKAGLAWAMTTIQPLAEMVDDLSGAPDIVASQTTTWTTASAALERIAIDLQTHLDRDFPHPRRPDTDAYLIMMSNNVTGLRMLAAVAATMAVITKAAGDLILLARDIIRGLIADLCAHIIIWAVGTTSVVALPVTASRLATTVAVTWRIHGYVTALSTSIANLSQYLADEGPP
jgi:hypothetical protein